MKKFLILLIFVFVCSALVTHVASAGDNKQAGGDEILKKSLLFDDPSFPPWQTSYPYPFSPATDPYPKTSPPISTGYYFVDNRETLPSFWQPTSNIVDTNFQSNLWRRIISGPHQQPAGYWPHENGYAFFRSWKNNAGQPIAGSWFDFPGGVPRDVDSTDNAYAGSRIVAMSFCEPRSWTRVLSS